jgi:UDP-N-acetylmuramyl pentapeptide phosphotransferase/UDP-N-acetylglucosamine-1-phosphate transferase
LQRTPVPVLGGIAVFFGTVVGGLVGMALHSLLHITPTMDLTTVFCAAILMLYIGAMDDMIGLSPLSRFFIEIITLFSIICATGLCVGQLNGLWGLYSINWWVAVVLTVFGGVGIINAINMIDGVNGLSSGLCITCCILFGLAFLLVGDVTNAMLAFTVTAALVPFFFHNVFGNRSRMFIGDAGTMMMGVLLTWFVIVMLNGDVTLWKAFFGHDVNLIALALAILSVPIFDTVRVMFMRIIHGKSPFHPDKTHLHHVFISMGVSHSVTAVSEIVMNLFVVGIWVVLVICAVPIDFQLYIIILVSLFLVWGVYFLFHWHETHHTELMHRFVRFSINTQFGHKQWWQRLERWFDGPEAKLEVKVQEVPKTEKSFAEFYHFDVIDPNNYKEQDRKLVYGFMKGLAEVYVDDIKRRSGANPLRVDAIIDEGILDGFIITIKEGVWGAPMIVSLMENKPNKEKKE